MSTEEKENKKGTFVEGQFDDAPENTTVFPVEQVSSSSAPLQNSGLCPNLQDFPGISSLLPPHFMNPNPPPPQNFPHILSPFGMPWTGVQQQVSSQVPAPVGDPTPPLNLIEGEAVQRNHLVYNLETIIKAAVKQSQAAAGLPANATDMPLAAGGSALELQLASALYQPPGPFDFFDSFMPPALADKSFPTNSATDGQSLKRIRPAGVPCRMPPIIIPPSPVLPKIEVKPVAEDKEKKNGIEDDDVTVADVLCGRGGGTNTHMGNVKLRRLVQEYRDQYENAKKNKKANIAKAVVYAIRADHGRFLKRDDDDELWYEVGDEKSVEKVSQQLREGRAKLRRVMYNASQEVSDESEKGDPVEPAKKRQKESKGEDLSA